MRGRRSERSEAESKKPGEVTLMVTLRDPSAARGMTEE